jgi:hypothetical protein
MSINDLRVAIRKATCLIPENHPKATCKWWDCEFINKLKGRYGR